MSVINAIKTRNSNASMSQDEVATDIIQQILDAAVCTPVHYGTNPWRFLVIRGDGRKKLGDFMAARMAKETADMNPECTALILDKMRKKSLRAPVIIVAAAAKPLNCAKAVMVENIASVSAACQNILLAADELGLSAIWRTGSLTYDPDTVEFLGFDKDTALVGFIYLGYPEKDPTVRLRESATPFTRWLE